MWVFGCSLQPPGADVAKEVARPWEDGQGDPRAGERGPRALLASHPGWPLTGPGEGDFLSGRAVKFRLLLPQFTLDRLMAFQPPRISSPSRSLF